MPGADMTTFDAMLKNDYLPPAQDQLNSNTYWKYKLEKVTKPAYGKRWIIPARTARNWGVGAIANGGALPTAGKQTWKELSAKFEENTGRLQIDNATIEASQNDRGAFASVARVEMEGLTNDINSNFNRQMLGDGRSPLGIIKAASIVIGPPGEFDALDMFSRETKQHYFEIGQVIEFRSAAGVLHANAAGATFFTVTDITSINHVVVSLALDGAIASGDLAYIRGSFSEEMDGLATAISASDPVKFPGGYQGVPVAGNPMWTATVSTAAAPRPLSLKLLDGVRYAIEKRSGHTVDLILTSYEGQSTYADLVTSLKRFPVTLELDGGWTALAYNDIPVMPERQCQNRVYWFLNMDSWVLYRTADLNWMERDGSILHYVPGFSAYEAVLVYYANLMNRQRNANGLLDQISMDTSAPAF